MLDKLSKQGSLELCHNHYKLFCYAKLWKCYGYTEVKQSKLSGVVVDLYNDYNFTPQIY